MSHFVSYQIDVLKKSDEALIKKSLEELGYQIKETKSVDNSYGYNVDVDFALSKDGKDLPIGFKRKGQNMVLEGDFWNMGFDGNLLLNDLSQIYVKNMIIQKLESTADYLVEEIAALDNGEIELTVNVG